MQPSDFQKRPAHRCNRGSNASRSPWLPRLIASTTTKTGLKIECELDGRTYAKGIKISKAVMQTLAIEGDPFHPEWNYTINPRRPERS